MTEQDHNDSSGDADDPLDSRLTELVAYLDGELADLDADRLERRLVSDAPLRSYAESLDRTWRLLDSLGETTASGGFTRKTLASLDAVPLDEDEELSKPQHRLVRLVTAAPWLKFSMWCFAGFLGGTSGLLLSRSLKSPKAESADTQILRQLDLLQDYRKLRPIPDVEFLRLVAEPNEPVAESGGESP